jgi:hypothetical protein
MTFDPVGEVNPFQAPRAHIGERAMAGEFETDTEAEIIRRAHIGHEASIKSIGLLNYLGAVFGGIATVCLVLIGLGLVPMSQRAADPNAPPPEAMRIVFLGIALVYLVLTVLNAAMGYGLRHLQVWARWTTVVFTVLGLIYTLLVSAVAALTNPIVGLISLLFGSLIPGYILYLMVSAKGGVVFSPEYKLVIAKTPHVKYKTSLIVKIFVGLLLFVFLLGVIVAIVSSFQPR